jgi:hypothetical protein
MEILAFTGCGRRSSRCQFDFAGKIENAGAKIPHGSGRMIRLLAGAKLRQW